MRALIVDDDSTCRMLLNRALSSHGRIDEAASGWDALAAVTSLLLRHRTYDLICLDIMMPDLDGFACLERIRRLEREAGILPGAESRVAMTTALDDYGSAKRAFAHLAEFFFIKPFVLKNVVDELRSAGVFGRPDRAPGGFDGEIVIASPAPAPLVGVLTQAGFQTCAVDSAAAAIAKVKECHAPLILLDAALPEVADGGLIADIIDHRPWIRVAVWYDQSTQSAHPLYRAGAMAACVKPLGDGTDLLRIIDCLAANLSDWRLHLGRSAELDRKAAPDPAAPTTRR